MFFCKAHSFASDADMAKLAIFMTSYETTLMFKLTGNDSKVNWTVDKPLSERLNHPLRTTYPVNHQNFF